MKKIHQDINMASTLDGEFYTSEIDFHNTLENVFARSWQLIIEKDRIKDNNSVFPFNFLGELLPEPLFLLKNNDTIRCFSNVCTHRGNILIDEPCIINNRIVCGYHGRQFDNCGKFKFMPKTEGMKNFPTEQDNLTEIATTSWRQFIFTSLSPAFKLNDLIKDIESRVGWMPIEDFKYREDLSREYFVDANWALYCDNYLEGFHIPFIHEGLNAVLDFNNYDVEIFQYSNLQIGIASSEDLCFNLPEDSKDYGRKIAAYYFWIFPNMMFNFYPWGLSLNIVTPLSINKTKIEFKSYVWDECKLDSGAGSNLNKVEIEDEEVVQNVQRGVRSRFYRNGRFSPEMEKGVHHFHSLINTFINANNSL